MFERGETSTSQTQLRGALSDVICSVEASRSHLIRPRGGGALILLALRGVEHPVAATVPVATPPPPAGVRSPVLINHLLFGRCYFYQANKVAWSRRTAGERRRPRSNMCTPYTHRRSALSLNLHPQGGKGKGIEEWNSSSDFEVEKKYLPFAEDERALSSAIGEDKN